jgi:hypothetical protein
LLPLVLLDLFYWLGARLSVDPLLDGPIALLEWAQRQAATDPNSQVAPSAADVAEQVALLRESGQQVDLLGLLAIGQSPLLPKLTVDQVGRPWGVGVIDLESGWLTILGMLGLVIVGLLWFALTLAVVGVLVRGDAPTPPEFVRRVVRFWGRLIVLGLLLIAAVLFLGVPLLVLAGLLQLLGLSPGGPLLLLVFPVLIAWIYLSRTTDAIAVSDAGPLRAIKLSVTVVRRNFWSMLRLFAAGWLISSGFPIAWAYLAQQTAGVPLAVVGNAFLNTGLLAAAMIFYRERLAALDQPAGAGGSQRQSPPPVERGDRR